MSPLVAHPSILPPFLNPVILGLLGPRFFRSTFGSLFLGLGPVLGALIEVIIGPEGPFLVELALGLFTLAFLAAGLGSGLLTLAMLGPILVLVGLNLSDPEALVALLLFLAAGADLGLLVALALSALVLAFWA